MKNSPTSKIQALIRKGVQIPNPASIEIGEEVDPDKFSENGVVIHAGCKIFGQSTSDRGSNSRAVIFKTVYFWKKQRWGMVRMFGMALSWKSKRAAHIR
jgi:hypothetical protein